MGSFTRNLIIIIFSVALLIPTVNANAQRDPCEGITPPDQIINLRAEQIGRTSTLLTWTMDFNRPNEAIDRFVIERGDGRDFVEYDTIKRVIEESRIDRTTRDDSFSYLDESAITRTTLFYKVKAGTSSLCFSPLSNTASTFVKERTGFTLVATGILVEDRTPTPTPPPPARFILGAFITDILNFDFLKAFAQFGSEPLVTTGQDPQLESYLFALTPIPVPSQYLGFPCNDSLSVFVKKDQFQGQAISFDITLFDNNSSSIIVSESFLTEHANRPHNEGYLLTDVQGLSIDHYQDLFVIIDQIDGLTGSGRALEIWEIEFLVPEDQGAC